MVQANNTAIFVPANITDAKASPRVWDPLAEFLACEVIPKNPMGFTFDVRSGSFPECEEDVYIVSLEGYERHFDGLPMQADVRSWLYDAAHVIGRRDVYVGGWMNTRSWRFFLDASVPIRGRSRAVRIGQITGQSTIYHAATRAVIPV